MYRLGIDVGGTNTDAIILDEQHQVVSYVKRHTSLDIGTGIINALKAVIDSTNVDPKEIKQVMLGTTQVTNAIVERKKIVPTGVIRLAYPATMAILPYTYWPADLVEKLGNNVAVVPGGFEYDGQELNELNDELIIKQFNDWKGKIGSLAIIGAFSALNTSQEKHTAELAREVFGEDFPITESNDVGAIGLIERENAAILNAGLVEVIKATVEGFESALIDQGVTNAELFLTQNDGTLMSANYAKKFPILTIGSGPTNSIRGASYLAHKNDAIVVDIGGTTTDLGVLKNGFPRESSIAVEVGGVTTNFRMPDILSIGLGGGSVVRENENGTVEVGPDSVGYKITDKALVFGGDTITATDIAVKLGLADIGDKSAVDVIDGEFAKKAFAEITRKIETAIDKMKTSAEKVDIILVGGGAIIAPNHLEGVNKILKFSMGGVANAIGASISQISGQVDTLYLYAQTSREEALEDAQNKATALAISSGAIASSVSVVEREEIPLAYHPEQANRVKIKVVGELQ